MRLEDMHEPPCVMALDGGSGAGKSTVAARLARELDVAVVPLDDFFSAHIPDAEWDTRSVEDRCRDVFDWERVRTHALQPLRLSASAAWHPVAFDQDMQPDGTFRLSTVPVTREPAPFVLLEGAYSAHPRLADLIDFAILLDVSVVERHARLAKREDRTFLEAWHQRWDEVEEFYFTRVRPKPSYDLVITTRRLQCP